jgi:hypothetical protein
MPRPTSEQRRLSQGWTLMEFRKKEQGERTQKKPPTRAQHEMMRSSGACVVGIKCGLQQSLWCSGLLFCM